MNRLHHLVVVLLFLADLAALGVFLHATFLGTDADIATVWLGDRTELISSRALPDGGRQWLCKADETARREIVQTLHAEPTDEDGVYQTPRPIILTDKAGPHLEEAYDVRLDCFEHGHLQLGWWRHEEDAFDFIPVRLPAEPPTFRRKLWELSAWVTLLGPAIPVDAALLLLLPFGPRRRRLWYGLPLVHAGILCVTIFLSGLKAGEPFNSLMAPLLALLWCPVSLLQSLLFGGIVRLCHALSCKQETPKMPQVPS